MNLAAILEQTRQNRPLVHAITNNITVNDCANIIHAVGGAPTMAQDEREVEEITALSQVLLLNMGALRVQESMRLAGRKANALGRPVVLDPVAAGASHFRGESCRRLLDAVQMTVIRGNASEIRALEEGTETTEGVEACAADRVTEEGLDAAVSRLQTFAAQTGAVVAQTGAIDLVCAPDGRAAILRGGSALMSRITGAGCMLSAVTAALCGANPHEPFEAAVCAVAVMNTCAQLAEARVTELMEGTASFRIRLIDAVSLLTPALLESGAQIELRGE